LGQSTSCEPGPDEVAFFQHSDFLGACEVRGIGDYPDSAAIGLQNDTISSVIVGADAQAVLCRDSGFKGNCELFARSEADLSDESLSDDHIGNDSVTAVKVQPRGTHECQPEPNQASFFMHSDFLAPCVVKGIGEYKDASQLGLDDNSISSIRVGADVQVCACG